MRYGMVVDTKRCIGCHTCAIACKNENNLPNNIWWNRVLTDGGDVNDTFRGEYPNLELTTYTVACQHCNNPACVKVCPVGATYKDPETGIVRQDYDKCIGCRMCMAACPYTGVRSFNWEEPKYYLEWPVGNPSVPAHQKHVVEKCTFCHTRLENGEEPFCVEVCLGRARYWGDLDDPESEVSRLINQRDHKRLLEDRDTDPSVYYLV